MENLVDFEKYLIAELTNPDRKRSFALETEKVNLELIINEILRRTGNDKYCVSLVETEDY